jgi:hypothetical protein
MDPVTRNSLVTETTCAYCQEKFIPNPRSRTPQKFCSTRCRVYFHREGGGPVTGSARAGRPDVGDVSLAGAIAALAGAIDLPSTAAVKAITVDRAGVYPASWVVTVPARSVNAAERVRDQLGEAADDLNTLRRKLEEAMKPARKARRSASG